MSARSGIDIEYCYPIDGPCTRGHVILHNDGEYSVEEVEALLELAMIGHHRRFGEVLFRPADLKWPSLAPTSGHPDGGHQKAEPGMHRIRRITLTHGAKKDVHASANELIDMLDNMINEQREARYAAVAPSPLL